MTGTISRRDFEVAPEEARLRLDVFLVRRAPEFSRARIQSFIRDGFVTVNGEVVRASETMRKADAVTLLEPPTQALDLQPEKIALSVLFEDEDLIVLNKPAGLSVHPGAGRNTGTLVNALLAHCDNLSGIGGIERPGIVHRLDKETSGCLVVAKNDLAHIALSEQFAQRTVEKIYLALAAGKMRKNSGTVEAAIARHRVHRQRMMVTDRGREARTDYRVVRSGPDATLVECRLHSGRTHQIRVHLQHIGHPILGDTIYAGRRAGKFPRQMLHAWKLAFDHPRTKARLHFEAPLPPDFEQAMNEVLA